MKKIIDIYEVKGERWFTFNDGSSERATSDKVIGEWVESKAKPISPMVLKTMMVFG